MTDGLGSRRYFCIFRDCAWTFDEQLATAIVDTTGMSQDEAFRTMAEACAVRTLEITEAALRKHMRQKHGQTIRTLYQSLEDDADRDPSTVSAQLDVQGEQDGEPVQRRGRPWHSFRPRN